MPEWSYRYFHNKVTDEWSSGVHGSHPRRLKAGRDRFHTMDDLEHFDIVAERPTTVGPWWPRDVPPELDIADICVGHPTWNPADVEAVDVAGDVDPRPPSQIVKELVAPPPSPPPLGPVDEALAELDTATTIAGIKAAAKKAFEALRK